MNNLNFYVRLFGLCVSRITASNTTRLSFLVERYVIKGGGGIEKVIL